MNDKLPTVQPNLSLTNALEGERPDPHEYFDSVYERLVVEQPELVEILEAYIQGSSRDSIEATNMRDVLVITYRTLEAQAELNAQNIDQK